MILLISRLNRFCMSEEWARLVIMAVKSEMESTVWMKSIAS